MAIQIPSSTMWHLPFDALAWIGGLAAGFIAARSGLTPQSWRAIPPTTTYLVVLAAGGILGAYLAGSIPSILRGEGGLGHSIAGALIGGIVAVEIYKPFAGINRSTGRPFVIPLTVGIIIGRWGCLMAGLPDQTFGSPTDSPWAVIYADGAPRHPVQIYESLAMTGFLAMFLLALAQRRRWAVQYGFHVMVAFYGAQRFAWEFLKPYPTLIGSLNSFHLVCAALVIYGIGWIATHPAGDDANA